MEEKIARADALIRFPLFNTHFGLKLMYIKTGCGDNNN